MNIVGVSALYHDSACCLLQDGRLIAAAQEERFTKKKADPAMPVNALHYCLTEGRITIADVDVLAYYEDPVKKFARQLWCGHDYGDKQLRLKIHPRRAENEIRDILGYEGVISFYEHHQSHAASSYFYSGFREAAICTIDGVGEWATTTYGHAQDNTLELFEEVYFPDSLGLLYAAITNYLGFKVNDGEYKVMGLAPYGKPVYLEKMRQLIANGSGGSYRLDMRYFDYINGDRMYSEEMTGLLGVPPRRPESQLAQCYKDLARSVQVLLEEVLIEKINYLYERAPSENLCLAGGVALNCVANGKVLEQGPFSRLYVQPAANDAGCALGAAALAYMQNGGSSKSMPRLDHVYLGPGYSNSEIAALLNSTSLRFSSYEDDRDSLIGETASRLARGQVIGWFEGRMEFGPRSLGARSILADPRDPDMRDKINAMVKKREAFRPFAPSVLEEQAAEHFDIGHASPFMLETCQVISGISLPAITHVDNSARIQTVSKETNALYHALISRFYALTDCPILLNTSFNVRGQPIVNTPLDALICFLKSGIDSLVIGDYLIDKSENSIETLEFILENYMDFHASDIMHDVYTFI